jgi:hypothetical protein
MRIWVWAVMMTVGEKAARSVASAVLINSWLILDPARAGPKSIARMVSPQARTLARQRFPMAGFARKLRSFHRVRGWVTRYGNIATINRPGTGDAIHHRRSCGPNNWPGRCLGACKSSVGVLREELRSGRGRLTVAAKEDF